MEGRKNVKNYFCLVKEKGAEAPLFMSTLVITNRNK